MAQWNPTKRQREVKAQFWQAFNSMQTWRTVESLSVNEIASLGLVQPGEFRDWMRGNGEFQAWFTNKNSARQRLMAGAELVADELMHMALSDMSDVKGGMAAKTKACELILKYTGIEPTAKEEAAKAEPMSAEDLDKLLSTQIPKFLSQLPPEQLKEVIGDNNIERLNAVDAEVLDE